MTDSDIPNLRERAENGDEDAVDELIELAGELSDMAELRRLADLGNSTAADELIQLAGSATWTSYDASRTKATPPPRTN